MSGARAGTNGEGVAIGTADCVIAGIVGRARSAGGIVRI
jgi:hypothetical protein